MKISIADWIMIGTLLCYLFTFYFVGTMDQDKRRGIYLGVKLSQNLLQQPDVQLILENYKRSSKKFLLMGLLALLPMPFFGYYFAVQFTYMLLFFLIIGLWPFKTIITYSDQLKSIKKNLGLYGDPKPAVIVDTKVAQFKMGYLPGIEWYLIAVFMACGPYLLNLGEPFHRNLIAVLSIFLGICFYVSSLWVKRIRNVVYVEDSSLNARLNYLRKRDTLALLAILANYEALSLIVLFGALEGSKNSMSWHWYVFIGMSFASIILPLIFIRRQRMRINKLMDNNQKPIYEDQYSDDELYWRGSIFYSNASNPKAFISRKDGLGTTVNIASAGGRIAIWLIVGFVALLLVPLWAMIVYDEIVPPATRVDSDQVTIQAGLYHSEFQLSDIESVMLVHELGKAMKSNGSATERYARGEFNTQEFGKCTFYIFTKSKPYVVIQLAEKTIVYSGLTQEDTLDFYEALR